LAHALKVELTDNDRETLRAFMATLPEDALLKEAEETPEENSQETRPDREEYRTLGNAL
jgi:hypothetical protein